MTFLNEARIILRHQPEEQVKQFLSMCDGRIPQEVDGAIGYRRPGERVIKLIKHDIRAFRLD